MGTTKSNSRKNDEAWRKVFERSDLLTQIKQVGYAYISAKELQCLSDLREPRLMVKLDCDSDRPQSFRAQKLNILPLKRGQYVIFRDPRNKCYFKFDPRTESDAPTPYVPKRNLQILETLQKELCSSETDVLSLASHSSLLSTFCRTTRLEPTKRGRFGSPKISITLPNSPVTVVADKSQIELDGVYESSDTIVIIEAKMGFPTEFHVRQLFYPYLSLAQQNYTKKLVPLLLCYSGGEFQLTEFRVGKRFGDLVQVRQEYFVLDNYIHARGDLPFLDRALPSAVEAAKIPFPQADDMNKIVDTVRQAQRGLLQLEGLAEFFGITVRQARYYRDAARYLNFLAPDMTLTKDGKQLLSERHWVNRTEHIMKRMYARPALREAIRLFYARGYNIDAISLRELEMLILAHRAYAPSTIHRRAQTIRTWLGWLLRNCNLDPKH